MFICPKCKERLVAQNNCYKCVSGHAFDISSKGYVNLLLSQKSGIHGDSKEMLSARRSFLELGHYSPIITKLCDIIERDCKKTVNILDAGCGEGYYTGKLCYELLNRGIKAEIYGIDVSKDGIGMAAKRYKQCRFAVSSVNELCFPDSSFDYVISLFAPISESEFERVMKPDGALITVSPAPRHLWGLKSLVYDNPYENEETTFTPLMLRMTEADTVESEMTLNTADDIENLFKMTPYYHKTSLAGKQKVNALERLQTYIGFMIYKFQK